MNIENFVLSLKEKGINLNSNQIKQFDQYYRILVEWNEKMNLTAITAESEVYLKHFYDSITPSFYFNFNDQMLCDVGAGAGFPSIPLKICFPNLKLTIVDSLNKRIQFLNFLATELNLTGIHFVHDRAETFGRIEKNREKFDIVTARAVARMSVLSELCLPLVKKGGSFIALKAANTEEELNAAKGALFTLGGKVKENIEFELPEEQSERHIVIIEKTKQTPHKYPRRPGIPNKEPLE
ncbi:MAG: rRNA ((527)-N(7))-methyltransferase RsmG [Bacillales bacterium]|jgi:16S rRNA (guanine527-N7)-methyltransferase|nr:rRNA ((527)-N(7))-methyltransferase RsmG [Bacillales bacterium]